MANRKKSKTYLDNKGRTIIEHTDGSSEMYIGGKDNWHRWLEVTDDTDRSIRRKRFLPDHSRPEGGGVATREPTPGIDLDTEQDDVEDS